MAVLIPDKADLRERNIKSDKEGSHTMIKGQSIKKK